MRYKPKNVGLRNKASGVNDKLRTDNPWRVQLTGHQYKALHSIGSLEKGREEFKRPCSTAVSGRTGNITIADFNK